MTSPEQDPENRVFPEPDPAEGDAIPTMGGRARGPLGRRAGAVFAEAGLSSTSPAFEGLTVNSARPLELLTTSPVLDRPEGTE